MERMKKTLSLDGVSKQLLNANLNHCSPASGYSGIVVLNDYLGRAGRRQHTVDARWNCADYIAGQFAYGQ